MGTEEATCFMPLTHNERTGLVLIGISSLISTIVILGLVGIAVRNFLRARRIQKLCGTSIYFNPIDFYFISLLLSDIFQGIGGLMSFRWAKLGFSFCGTFCDAQGAMQQVAEQSCAISVIWIAVITFAVIFFEWNPSWWCAIVGLGLSWTFIFLDVIIGWAVHHDTVTAGGIFRYYTPTPYWCFISSSYTTQRILTGYIWIWICAPLCAVIYTLLFFQLRGNIIVVATFPRFRLVFRQRTTAIAQARVGGLTGASPHLRDREFRRNLSTESVRGREATMSDAKKMLVYPVAYITLVAPVSVVRWLTFTGHNPPFAATEAAMVIFKLSGLVNVLVFMLTRPGLLTFVGRDGRRSPKAAGVRLEVPGASEYRDVEGYQAGDVPLDVIRVGRPSGSVSEGHSRPDTRGTRSDEDAPGSKSAPAPASASGHGHGNGGVRSGDGSASHHGGGRSNHSHSNHYQRPQQGSRPDPTPPLISHSTAGVRTYTSTPTSKVVPLGRPPFHTPLSVALRPPPVPPKPTNYPSSSSRSVVRPPHSSIPAVRPPQQTLQPLPAGVSLDAEPGSVASGGRYPPLMSHFLGQSGAIPSKPSRVRLVHPQTVNVLQHPNQHQHQHRPVGPRFLLGRDWHPAHLPSETLPVTVTDLSRPPLLYHASTFPPALGTGKSGLFRKPSLPSLWFDDSDLSSPVSKRDERFEGSEGAGEGEREMGDVEGVRENRASIGGTASFRGSLRREDVLERKKRLSGVPSVAAVPSTAKKRPKSAMEQGSRSQHVPSTPGYATFSPGEGTKILERAKRVGERNPIPSTFLDIH